MHNPFAGWRVTDVWRAGHYAVDYGMDAGVSFGAPAAGVYRHDGPWKDAGNRGVLTLADGRVIVFCHLSSHVAPHGARVAEGDTLARIGNTGTSFGPHMHTFGLTASGNRWNWTLEAGAKPAPKPAAVPVAALPTVEVDQMRTFNIVGQGIWFAAPGIAPVHVKNTSHLKLLQRYIVAPAVGDKRETFNAVELRIIGAYLQGKTPA